MFGNWPAIIVVALCIINLSYETTGKNKRYEKTLVGIHDDFGEDPRTLSQLMVFYNHSTSKPATVTKGEISIGSTANRDVTFDFTVSGHQDCEVSLRSPNGTRFDNASTVYTTDRQRWMVGFALNIAEVGTWTYKTVCSRPVLVSIVVKSPSINREAYQVEFWLSSTAYDVTKVDNPIVVYVYVHKGYTPVIDADVTVRVDRPGHVTSLTLMPRDDGLLPDTKAADGVFSVNFTQLTEDGKYHFNVDVTSTLNKTKYLTKGLLIYEGNASCYKNCTMQKESEYALNSVATLPGVLDVKNYTSEDDSSSLRSVTDLKVVDIDVTEGVVTLSWTAPGNEDHRNAVRYDFRICHSSEGVSQAFDNCSRVYLNMIVKGSLIPKAAGSKERITIKVGSNFTSGVFVMKAMDEGGIYSEVSNSLLAVIQSSTTIGHFNSKTMTTTTKNNQFSTTTTTTTTTTTNISSTKARTTTTTSLTTSTTTTSKPTSTTTPTSTPTSTPTTAKKMTTTTTTSTISATFSTTTIKISPEITTPTTFTSSSETTSTTTLFSDTSPTTSLSSREKRTIFIASTVGGIAALAIFIAVILLVMKMRNRFCTQKDKYEAKKRAQNMQKLERMDLVSDTRERNYLPPSGRYL